MSLHQQLHKRLTDLNYDTKAIHDFEHEEALPQIVHKLKRSRQRLYWIQLPVTLILVVLYIYYSHYASGFLEDRIMAIRTSGILCIASFIRLIFDQNRLLKLQEQRFIARLFH
jgi:uncharacterized membrane protein (DUF485 family)